MNNLTRDCENKTPNCEKCIKAPAPITLLEFREHARTRAAVCVSVYKPLKSRINVRQINYVQEPVTYPD